jgi:MFS transporter, DHA2 family, multidrug resistance protein
MARLSPAITQGWTPARSVAGGRNPWTIVAVISIATFMMVLDTSIANVALAHIAGSLSVTYDEATWIITSFLIASAVIIPISGWLADVIGRKRYYMTSVALFTAASFLCGIAPNLTMLIIARVLQGVGGGGLAPVEQSMLVDTFPPEKRSLAFAAYGVVVIVGPIAGPTLGGWITDNFTWHWVFLINVPVGMLSLFLVESYVDEPLAVVRRTKEILGRGFRIDFVGFALSALFLGCLEVTLDRGQREDWFSDPLIVGFALTSALALVAFIPWELTRRDPIVRIDLLKQWNFAIANVLFLVIGLILFGTTLFIPQFLQEVLGYTATDAGLAMTAGGIATIFVMPLAGILANRIDPRILVGAAFIIQGTALWNMAQLNTHITFWDASLARMWQAIGLPFLFVPITNVAYVGLKPDDNNQASALMNVARNLGGTIGISLVQTLLAQRMQFHQARYVETLNPLNPNYGSAIRTISRGLSARGVAPADADHVAIAELYHRLLQQAQMLSFVEAFHLMMIVVFCALPLVLVLRQPTRGTSANVEAAP